MQAFEETFSNLGDEIVMACDAGCWGLVLENEEGKKFRWSGRLLDELDVLECFTEPVKTPIQGEVLKKQEDLYTAMDVAPLYAKPSVETPGI